MMWNYLLLWDMQDLVLPNQWVSISPTEPSPVLPQMSKATDCCINQAMLRWLQVTSGEVDLCSNSYLLLSWIRRRLSHFSRSTFLLPILHPSFLHIYKHSQADKPDLHRVLVICPLTENLYLVSFHMVDALHIRHVWQCFSPGVDLNPTTNQPER